jgi:thermitase
MIFTIIYAFASDIGITPEVIAEAPIEFDPTQQQLEDVDTIHYYLAGNYIVKLNNGEEEFKDKVLSKEYSQDKRRFRDETYLVISIKEVSELLKIDHEDYVQWNNQEDKVLEEILDPETVEFLKEIKRDGNVKSVEPYYLYKTSSTPSDTLFRSQWGHQNSFSKGVWDNQKGSREITIAIADSGVDYTHEDLRDAMLGDCATENLCPEGTGYDFVDMTQESYDYYQKVGSTVDGEDYLLQDSDPMDFGGHGTHVAGIAAANENGTGVVGVCPQCTIMPLRVGYSLIIDGQETGIIDTFAAAQATVYAVDNGADVINMSFGGPSETQVLTEAINYATEKGVIVIVAAGNNNSDFGGYPAMNENVITVAATSQLDTRASYSNYGNYVDIAAPGGDGSKDSMIISTVMSKGSISDPTGYAAIQGTSMAAPYVSGLAGLLISEDMEDGSRDITVEDLRSILKSTSDRSTSNRIFNIVGLVNSEKAYNQVNAQYNKLTTNTEAAVLDQFLEPEVIAIVLTALIVVSLALVAAILVKRKTYK